MSSEDVSQESYAVYEELKSLLKFSEQDVQNLVELRGLIESSIPTITDQFYEVLQSHGATATFIEGRVDQLKKTHISWFMDVLGGEYGSGFFARQFAIGLAHVRISLPPQFVEGIMSFIRSESIKAVSSLVNDTHKAGELEASLTKILDINLAIINLSYHENRLDKLTHVTGMKRKLLENLILQG